MKCSKDRKSLNEKMLCFVTSIPHVGNNRIIKENVSLLQVFHRETLMYGEETWTWTKRLNGSTMKPGKDKLINIREDSMDIRTNDNTIPKTVNMKLKRKYP
jgi:hypothetical protein